MYTKKETRSFEKIYVENTLIRRLHFKVILKKKQNNKGKQINNKTIRQMGL